MTGQRYRMGVFDRPVLRDWAFWHGIGWSVAIGMSTLFNPVEDSTTPVWVDAPGVAVLTFLMVGWPVAAVRRIVRELRRRMQRRGETPPVHSSPPPPSSANRQPPASGAPAPDRPSLPPAYRTTPATAAPIPLSSYSAAGMRESEALVRARLQLPYPVARAARAVQTTQDPLEQYQYLLDLGEALTLTLGMLSASWLRQHAPQDSSLQMLHESFFLRGVSQGHWHEVTKAAEKAMAVSGAGLPGFVDGVRSRRGDPGAVDAVKVILAERNMAAHGARPHNRAEAAVRIAELSPTVIHAVDRASFLGETQWVLVEGVALRRHDKRWNARFRKAMSDHPEFDAVTQVIDYPLANDTFYVMTEPPPLDLTPMLVIRYCDQCRQSEVCHADRVDELAGVSLKSFARGHQVFDRDLVHEVNSLVPSDSLGNAEGA